MSRLCKSLLFVVLSTLLVSGCAGPGGPPGHVRGGGAAPGRGGSADPGRGAGLDIRLRLVAGQRFRRQMVTETEMVQDIRGAQKRSETETIGLTFAVEHVDPETSRATVAVTFDYLAVTMHAPVIGVVEYDSRNEPEHMSPALYGTRAVVGLTFQMVIDPKARIIAITGLDEMLARAAEKLPKAYRSQLAASLKKAYSENALRKKLRPLLPDPPAGAVALGEQWTTRSVTVGDLPLLVNNTWSLAERSDQVAILRVSAEVASSDQEQNARALFRVDMSGTLNGVIRVDARTGWVHSGEFTIDLSGSWTRRGEREVTIPVTQKTSIRVTPIAASQAPEQP